MLHSVWRHLAASDESLCCLIQVPMLLAALVLVPFLGSLLAAVMPADARNRESWLAIAVAAGGLLMAGSLYPDVAAGQVLRERLAPIAPGRAPRIDVIGVASVLPGASVDAIWLLKANSS